MEIAIGSYKIRVEIVIAIVIVFWIMCGHMLCGCSKISFSEGMTLMKNKLKWSKLEGFTASNTSVIAPEYAGAQSPDYIMNPSTWSSPTLSYNRGSNPGAGVKAIWDRPKQPIPLPEGELDMFATTEFKPECCPNAYSSSTGCACMTVDQYTYIRERGSNNVPYSEY